MLTDWIPEPTIILLGCQTWPPKGCPCGGGVHEGDDSTYCAVCDSLSPRRERQVRAARAGLKAKDRSESAAQKAKAALRKAPVLTESERRRLWNGYRGGILGPVDDITNLSKAGRDFLIATGQEPDWSLVLSRFGKVVGHLELEPEPV